MDDGTLGNSASRKIMFDEVKRQAKQEILELKKHCPYCKELVKLKDMQDWKAKGSEGKE